jgi:hypothetical protein
MNTKEIIQNLIDTSDTCILFTSEITGNDDNLITWGLFTWDRGSKHEQTRIEILAKMSDYRTLSTLLHELKHAECYKNKCYCHTTKVASERHAYKYSLQWLLKHKCKDVLKFQLKHIDIQAKRDDYYGIACREIQDSKLYKQCRNFVRPTLVQKVYKWLTPTQNNYLKFNKGNIMIQPIKVVKNLSPEQKAIIKQSQKNIVAKYRLCLISFTNFVKALRINYLRFHTTE